MAVTKYIAANKPFQINSLNVGIAAGIMMNDANERTKK